MLKISAITLAILSTSTFAVELTEFSNGDVATAEAFNNNFSKLNEQTVTNSTTIDSNKVSIDTNKGSIDTNAVAIRSHTAEIDANTNALLSMTASNTPSLYNSESGEKVADVITYSIDSESGGVKFTALINGLIFSVGGEDREINIEESEYFSDINCTTPLAEEYGVTARYLGPLVVAYYDNKLLGIDKDSTDFIPENAGTVTIDGIDREFTKMYEYSRLKYNNLEHYVDYNNGDWENGPVELEQKECVVNYSALVSFETEEGRSFYPFNANLLTTSEVAIPEIFEIYTDTENEYDNDNEPKLLLKEDIIISF